MPAFYQAVDDIQEDPLNVLLVQVRRGAFLITFEFAVALPDGALVFAGAVPDLAAINVSAVTVDDTAGKAAAAGNIAPILPALKLTLHMFEQLSAHDGGVAASHIVLGDLALVFLDFLGQVIRAEGLLRYLPRNDKMHPPRQLSNYLRRGGAKRWEALINQGKRGFWGTGYDGRLGALMAMEQQMMSSLV